MSAKTKDFALIFTDLKNGEMKIERIETQPDRTRRPMRPELIKQIEARYGKRTPPKSKRKK